MRTNRVFQPLKSLKISPQQQYLDVATTAHAAGYRLRLFMAPDLVRQYVVCDSDSDDGVTFIKLFIQELELALSEKTLAVRMSHGNWLSLRFDLPARHRRKGISEVLHLLVLLGPCASNETSIYVLRTSRALPIDEPPF